jgi:hypothetical protein
MNGDNETRRVISRAVRRAEKAISLFDQTQGIEGVIDMLTDTMHWCQRHEVDFLAALDTAERHFSDEGGYHHRRP